MAISRLADSLHQDLFPVPKDQVVSSIKQELAFFLQCSINFASLNIFSLLNQVLIIPINSEEVKTCLAEGKLMKGLMLFFLLFVCLFRSGFGSTNSRDVSALKSLSNQWKNTPENWKIGDPCGDSWIGITCNNSDVTGLKLFNMDIMGQLSSSIGDLTELVDLDLSFNHNLDGLLPASIGNLKQLQTLRLINCNFNGLIPAEVGNLLNLEVLSLNSNKFTGEIPASLGKLSKLVWLDLADNQLYGTIPISKNGSPGLDQLVKNLHFHLNLNKLSGPIPSDFFSSNLTAIHMLLDHNNFSGEIPASIGLVTTLEAVRLDNNYLNGSVPSSINNLTLLDFLSLANNDLIGPMPNLTGLNNLRYLDLSNNSFSPSGAPAWFAELANLTTLIIESGNLHGEMPQALFSLPGLEEVKLNNNFFNGTLNMGSNVSLELLTVEFQNNNFTAVTISSGYRKKILLEGNPVCSNDQLMGTKYCGQQDALPIPSSKIPYCSSPYQGSIVCRAPCFSDSDINNSTEIMRETVSSKLREFPVTPFFGVNFFDENNYLHAMLQVCHNYSTSFTRNETLSWLDLTSQRLNLSGIYGPCFFAAQPYTFDSKGRRGWITGVVVGSVAAVLVIAGLGAYAVWQRKRAKKATFVNNPFASWGSNGEEDGAAPQIKLARYFSQDEIRKFTGDFSKENEIGAGGYGKVYKGMLPDGQIVAIKRLQKGSSQGALEFKTEIELLSRVHHKNLVELVGFCFEKGERTLVYEYISNGTLIENLLGKNRMYLDWRMRLAIALDSARGLAYLHELAKPPIIHRDVKSSNILLDDNFTAKVADFGLSTLVADTENGHVSTGVKGTPGYLDPEYLMTQQLTAKSDVYSFGVVLFELMTAKLPIMNGRHITYEVRTTINEDDVEFYGLKGVIDPALLLHTGTLVGFKRFVDLALRCVEESSEDRPTMNDVVKEIELILKDNESMGGPSNNPRSPSATYFGNLNGGYPQFSGEMAAAFSSGVTTSTDTGYGSDQYLLSK